MKEHVLRPALVSAVAIFGLGGYVFGLQGWELRKGTEELRRQFLAENPPRSTIGVVAQNLRAKGLSPVLSNKGFLKQPAGSAMSIVGDSSIRVELGEYRVFPFPKVSVTGFWGFNSEGKLVDVWVWKTTDAL